MSLTKKTMILFDMEQYEKLKEFAKKHHKSMGQLIRESVETMVLKKANIEERVQAAMRLTSAEEMVEWEEFERAVSKGHLGGR